MRKNQINFIILAHWANAFRHSVDLIPAGLTEKTIKNFNHFRTLSENFSPFCQKNWSRAARTAFYVFTGTFWKIYFPEKSLKILFCFSDTERKCFGFLSFFFNEVVNSVFYVSTGTVRWKIFSKKVFRFSFFLRTLTGKNSLIRQAFFSRVVETAFYVSIDTFWGEFFHKNFSLSSFINEHNFFCCKNCILRVPRYILTKDFFEENVCFFFNSFVFWANILSFLSDYFEQDCRNWNLPVDRKLWRKLGFSKKMLVFLFFLSEMSEKFSTFWRKLFGRVVKTASNVCIGSFWEVLFEKKIDTFILLAHWTNLFRHSVEVFPAGLSEEPSKFLTIFGHWAQAFRLFVRKTSYRAAKTEFYLFTGTGWKKNFLERTSVTFFIFFGHWAKVFLAFYQLFLDQVVKSVFYVSIGTLWWKIFCKNFFKLSILFHSLTG